MTEARECKNASWKLVSMAMLGLAVIGIFERVSAFSGEHMMRTSGVMMHGPNHIHMFHMMDELELTSEQRNVIGEIMDDAMPRARKLRFALMENHKELKALATDKVFDPKAAERRARDVGDKVAALTLLRSSSAANMLAVLTSEQRQRFDKLSEKHRIHRGKHRIHHCNMEHHPPTKK